MLCSRRVIAGWLKCRRFDAFAIDLVSDTAMNASMSAKFMSLTGVANDVYQ
jgi:hypothetical protein